VSDLEQEYELAMDSFFAESDPDRMMAARGVALADFECPACGGIDCDCDA
jgi:hypothetical protein